MEGRSGSSRSRSTPRSIFHLGRSVSSFTLDLLFSFPGNLTDKISTEKYQLQSHCEEWVNKDIVKKAYEVVFFSWTVEL